jgi:hypothetical protein
LPCLRRSLLRPLSVQYRGEVGLSLSQAVANFNFDASVQLDLYTFAELLLLPIVKVSNVIFRVIIDHDASIEGVKAKRSIVPFLRLLMQVSGV